MSQVYVHKRIISAAYKHNMVQHEISETKFITEEHSKTSHGLVLSESGERKRASERAR